MTDFRKVFLSKELKSRMMTNGGDKRRIGEGFIRVCLLIPEVDDHITHRFLIGCGVFADIGEFGVYQLHQRL